MRLTSTLAVVAVFGFANWAQAQTVATWQDVQVNPVRPGGGVLLYPGGEYSRVAPPLLYPGESSAPVQLHMPVPHRRTVASAAPRPARPKPEAPPKRVAAKPAPAPKAAPKIAKAEPPPASAPSATYNPFGGATDLSN